MIYCPYCVKQNDENDVHCKFCGKQLHIMNDSSALAIGTMLAGRYYIGRMIRKGGFGITYVGCDTRLNKIVAIKEYFPSAFASRETGDSQYVTISGMKSSELFEKEKQKFISEAHTLADFAVERSIVSITDILSENDTVYLVMEFVDGVDLDQYIKTNPRMTFQSAFYMLMPIITTMGRVHKKGLIHRDITPANIKVLPDGSAVLLDFGAAREFDGDGNEEMSVILKPGYAPAEQYQSNGAQGPWTDVYGVCATLYKMITGITPVNAIDRMMQDRLVRPISAGAVISASEEAALLRGLEVDKDRRTQSMEALYADLIRALQESGNANFESDRYDDSEETVLLTDEMTMVLSEEENRGIVSGGRSKEDSLYARKSLFAILIIAFLGIAAVGGFFLFSRSKENDEQLKQENEEHMPESREKEASDTDRDSLATVPMVIEGSNILIAGESSYYYVSDGDKPIRAEEYAATVKWESSDPEVAAIENGVVKAVSEGRALLKASLKDKSVEKEVYVAGVNEDSQIQLISEPEEIVLKPDEEDKVYTCKVYLDQNGGGEEERFLMDYYCSDSLTNVMSLEWGTLFNGGVNVEIAASEVKEGYITIYLWREEAPDEILAATRIAVLADNDAGEE